MRGSLSVRQVKASSIRIIPAHAGLTGLELIEEIYPRDHPRACGAHTEGRWFTGRWKGSSPRMRGSQIIHAVYVVDVGIIPAHAGLTRNGIPPTRSSRDHPRACGAHSRCAARIESWPGSSPRMRGSPLVIKVQELLHGIIPAHAGLTVLHRVWATLWRDHPRACGAHTRFCIVIHPSTGSSPRMRGSLTSRMSFGDAMGIIPAHAGLTIVPLICVLMTWDHPRACGAHHSTLNLCFNDMGSSPRMRGSLYSTSIESLITGIIPAHAGLTLL